MFSKEWLKTVDLGYKDFGCVYSQLGIPLHHKLKTIQGSCVLHNLLPTGRA